MRLAVGKFKDKFKFCFMIFYPEHGGCPQLGNGWNSDNSYGSYLVSSSDALREFMIPYILGNAQFSLHTNVRNCLNSITNFQANTMSKIIVFTCSSTDFNDVEELISITSQKELDSFYEQYDIKVA